MRHRFSEFEAMRNDLKATYATYGITVPTMPPKKIIVQADDTDFIKERTHGLTIFCQAIIASPWLRFDRTWIDFMRTGGGDSGKAGSVGESMLLLSYAQLEPPGNAYARMNEFKDELLLVERRLLALITAAKSMQAAQAELAKSNDSVATALTEWVDVEVNNARLMGGDSGSGGSLIKNPYRVKTTATAVSNFQTAKAKMNEGSALQSGVLLIVALEHELSRIESFRELFVAHDKLYSEIDTLALKEQKMRGSKDAGRKRDDIAELSKQVLDKRNLLTMFYKGLFHYSMPMNVRQRAINLRMSFNMMAAQHQVTSSENMMLASSYFEEMHASPAACASDASAVLDLLGMKTLVPSRQLHWKCGTKLWLRTPRGSHLPSTTTRRSTLRRPAETMTTLPPRRPRTALLPRVGGMATRTGLWLAATPLLLPPHLLPHRQSLHPRLSSKVAEVQCLASWEDAQVPPHPHPLPIAVLWKRCLRRYTTVKPRPRPLQQRLNQSRHLHPPQWRCLLHR